MSDFITLTCPSCNGKLQITDDIDRFACAHCGCEHIVKRSGGMVAIKPVLDTVAKCVDNTASELAIVRLDREISEVEEKLLPIKSAVDSASGFLVIGILLAILGVALWIFSECSGGGAIFTALGVIVAFGYLVNLGKKYEKEELEEQLKKLKTSRQTHYDKVNK